MIIVIDLKLYKQLLEKLKTKLGQANTVGAKATGCTGLGKNYEKLLKVNK